MSSAVRILAFPKEAAFDILLTFTNSVIGYTMCVFNFFMTVYTLVALIWFLSDPGVSGVRSMGLVVSN